MKYEELYKWAEGNLVRSDDRGFFATDIIQALNELEEYRNLMLEIVDVIEAGGSDFDLRLSRIVRNALIILEENNDERL